VKRGPGESGVAGGPCGPGGPGEPAGRSAAHKTLSRARAWRVAHKGCCKGGFRAGRGCQRWWLHSEFSNTWPTRYTPRCDEIPSRAFIFYSFAVSPAIYAQQGATTSPLGHQRDRDGCSWCFHSAVKSAVLTLNCESAIQAGPLECRCHLRLLANACGWPQLNLKDFS